MNKADVIDRLRQTKAAPLADFLSELLKPSLQILTQRRALSELPLGASRMGGCPDMPPDFSWPHFEDYPLDFLCQLDLEEVARAECVAGLPKTGWLLFFYHDEEQPWGFDPKDAGKFHVLYFDCPRDSLTRKETPPRPSPKPVPQGLGGLLGRLFSKGERQEANAADPDYPDAFESCRLEFLCRWTPPDPLDEIQGITVDDNLFDDYAEFVADLEGDPPLNDLNHRILGYPSVVQNPMELECQLVTNGIYCGSSKGYNSAKARSLEGGARDWILLLQIDSDDDGPGWMWGDMGRLYYWIRREDLAAKNFDRAWVILQCG